jgi:hypothetical protein
MLRVSDFRFAVIHSKKCGVEGLGSVRESRCPDIIWIGERPSINPRIAQLIVRQEADGFNAVPEVLPKRLNVRSAGKAAAHSYDGYRITI